MDKDQLQKIINASGVSGRTAKKLHDAFDGLEDSGTPSSPRRSRSTGHGSAAIDDTPVPTL